MQRPQDQWIGILRHLVDQIRLAKKRIRGSGHFQLTCHGSANSGQILGIFGVRVFVILAEPGDNIVHVVGGGVQSQFIASSDESLLKWRATRQIFTAGVRLVTVWMATRC